MEQTGSSYIVKPRIQEYGGQASEGWVLSRGLPGREVEEERDRLKLQLHAAQTAEEKVRGERA